VSEGVFTGQACLIGTMYTDCNNNHVQDSEEVGIPGVRIYLENGDFVITDSEGKYSMCDLSPQTHVLKVDKLTLPRGSRLTTTSNRNAGDPATLFVDPKRGELHRGDFAVGSCSNTVLEQVRARRSKGEVRAVESEPRGGKALKFNGKPASKPERSTETPNQPIVKPRDASPAKAVPDKPVSHVQDVPVPELPAASHRTTNDDEEEVNQ